MGTRLMIQDVRTSFLHCFAPFKGALNSDDQGRYQVHILLDPEQDADKLKAIKNAIMAEINGDALKGKKPAAEKLCLRRGDTKADKYPYYAGMWYVSANSTVKPTVIDRDRSPLVEADGRPYSGCRANVSIEVWGQVHRVGGPQVNATFRGIQFWADGEAFGGSPPAAVDEFPAGEGGGITGADSELF